MRDDDLNRELVCGLKRPRVRHLPFASFPPRHLFLARVEDKLRRSNERHRADCKQRLPFPPPTEPEEEDDESKSQARRRPLSAIACSARYRSRVYIDTLDETAEDISDTMVKAMSREKLKQVCLNALRGIGFAVTLRDKAKRDRSAETARRSEKRAKIREEKAALKAQIRAEEAAKPKVAVTPGVTPTTI